MDVGGLGEILSYQALAHVHDPRAQDSVPEEKSERVDVERPLTEVQRQQKLERRRNEFEASSEKVQLEKEETPTNEEVSARRGEDGIKNNTIDLLA